MTDVKIPVVWLLFPLANYLLWAVFAVALWSAGAELGTGELSLVISGLGVLGLAGSAAASYVVYTLVNRGNKHFGRTRALLWSALDVLESRVGTSGQQVLLPLTSAEESFYKLTRGERQRSAVLWALLSLIPFVGWIFLAIAQWFLSRDLLKHGRLEELVLEDVDRSLRLVGLQGIPIRYVRVRSHDAIGYAVVVVSILELFSAFLLGLTGALVLIYLTVGAFSLFWVDLSIRDPTDHFDYHSQFEGELIRSLPGLGTGTVGVA